MLLSICVRVSPVCICVCASAPCLCICVCGHIVSVCLWARTLDSRSWVFGFGLGFRFSFVPNMLEEGWCYCFSLLPLCFRSVRAGYWCLLLFVVYVWWPAIGLCLRLGIMSRLSLCVYMCVCVSLRWMYLSIYVSSQVNCELQGEVWLRRQGHLHSHNRSRHWVPLLTPWQPGVCACAWGLQTRFATPLSSRICQQRLRTTHRPTTNSQHTANKHTKRSNELKKQSESF